MIILPFKCIWTLVFMHVGEAVSIWSKPYSHNGSVWTKYYSTPHKTLQGTIRDVPSQSLITCEHRCTITAIGVHVEFYKPHLYPKHPPVGSEDVTIITTHRKESPISDQQGVMTFSSLGAKHRRCTYSTINIIHLLAEISSN